MSYNSDYFRRLRYEVTQIPSDEINKLDGVRLKNFLMATLKCCEYHTSEHDEGDVDRANCSNRC